MSHLSEVEMTMLPRSRSFRSAAVSPAGSVICKSRQHTTKKAKDRHGNRERKQLEWHVKLWRWLDNQCLQVTQSMLCIPDHLLASRSVTPLASRSVTPPCCHRPTGPPVSSTTVSPSPLPNFSDHSAMRTRVMASRGATYTHLGGSGQRKGTVP
jgi:hypothetical protein